MAAINQKVLQEISGAEREYYSIEESESTGGEHSENQLSVEFLQSLNPASLPPSKLKLKIGAPVILLHKLYPKEGLFNGTRMTITRMERWCIQVQILGRQFNGSSKILPGIKLSPTDGEGAIYSHPQVIPNSTIICDDCKQGSRSIT